MIFVNGKRSAFTLIEILIVMVIIGFMVTIIPSWIFKKKVDATLPAVMSEFNNLLLIARQQAVLNQKTCRLFFKSEKNLRDYVVVQIMEQDPENSEKKVFKVASSEYLDTKYDLPKGIKLEAVYLDGNELFSENKGEAYCYITPNSLVQDIMVHIIRRLDDLDQKATFKIEPFIGEFELYNGFLKPQK
ncbi:prepilin-type N-terminal cleavage/methylation domain-containing protein [Candidatus Dependentiae bacterium]|nr:prepilin-type N-terminal cleavage/methylation domain-containing protein [Candidatus Dependentiae bacterium]